MQTRSIEVDAKTGREVWRISPAGATAEAVYFESQAFTADEACCIYRSEITGQSEIYRFDMKTGQSTQLTQDSGTEQGQSITMAPDGRTCYFYAHNRLLRLSDIYAKETPAQAETLVDFGATFGAWVMPYPVSFSTDGQRIALAVAEEDGPMHLYVLGLPDLHFRKVCTIREGFSHPMICPGDRDLISFVKRGNACWNMDAPDEKRTRTWVVRVDEGRPRSFITPIRYRVVTHESWSPDGERMYFFDKTYPKWCPVSICSVDRRGNDWQAHFTSYTYHLGHGVLSHNGHRFLSDCQENGNSPLLLVDMHVRRYDIICWPDATQEGGHKAVAHVHPSFSPSDNYVIYTTDKAGTAQVYVAPIADLMTSTATTVKTTSVR